MKLLFKKSLFICFFLTLIVLVITIPAKADNWTTQVVVPFRTLGAMSITVDSSLHPQIAYGGNQLQYVFFNGNIWQYEVVDSGDIGYVSLSLDSLGNAHICYNQRILFGSTYIRVLKYATNAWGPWVTMRLDSSDISQVGDVSLAIDSSDKIHQKRLKIRVSAVQFCVSAPFIASTYGQPIFTVPRQNSYLLISLTFCVV